MADTGAAVSLIPGPPSSEGQALTAANSAAIATGAEQNLQLSFLDSNSHSHWFNFDFIQGSVDGPILGIDFLHHFGLIVDPLAACVRHSNGTVFRGSLSSSLSNVVLSALPSDIQPLGGWCSVALLQPVEQPPTHGAQEGWELAAMW